MISTTLKHNNTQLHNLCVTEGAAASAAEKRGFAADTPRPAAGTKINETEISIVAFLFYGFLVDNDVYEL